MASTRSPIRIAVAACAAFVLALAFPAGAHINNRPRHNWNRHYLRLAQKSFFTEAELQTPGTLNDPGNPVDWTKLANVPADLADGDDTGGLANDLDCPGCVDTADLANDAVTSAKIENGTILLADLGFDPATQQELNAYVPDWNDLANVPGGFADGVDDTGGTASDLICDPVGCVGTADLAGDAVTSGKIGAGEVDTADLANGAVTDAKASADLARTADLETSDGDGPNLGSNQVHWDNLGGVPADIADGDDAGQPPWLLAGNAGTTPDGAGGEFLGTTDGQPLVIKVDGDRVARFEPATTPSVIFGFGGNDVSTSGAAIGGGGQTGAVNLVTDDFGTVSGGSGNTAGNGTGGSTDRTYATVGGGFNNTASGADSVVGGGNGNTAGGLRSAVGGGTNNSASGGDATIGAGSSNAASGDLSLVGGGFSNLASNTEAVVAGGHDNTAAGIASTVGGGNTNSAAGTDAAVAGGNTNSAGATQATVGGGFSNEAGGQRSTVGGGDDNAANHIAATVAGGRSNDATAEAATISGGDDNTASSIGAFVGGGVLNEATNQYAAIGGGYNNSATGQKSFIGGGIGNQANGDNAIVGGGVSNQANGSTSTIGGGYDNRATGNFSTVPGGTAAVASQWGQMAHASGHFGILGGAQTSQFVLRRATSDATPSELFLNGVDGRLTVSGWPEPRTMIFNALIVGRTGSGLSAGYSVAGLIENVGGTTSLVGAPAVTVLGEDVAAWDAMVSADDVNDALKIEVTGSAGENIRWVAMVETVEVVF